MCPWAKILRTSRTSEAKLLMDLSDVLHNTLYYNSYNRIATPRSAVRHIYKSTTAVLKRDDKVILRQESNGGFYYDRARALRLSFTGALLRATDDAKSDI